MSFELLFLKNLIFKIKFRVIEDIDGNENGHISRLGVMHALVYTQSKVISKSTLSLNVITKLSFN